MANNGLKPFSNQIEQSLGNVAKMSLSLAKQDANLIVTIPLLKSIGMSQIDTSLVFNLQI